MVSFKTTLQRFGLSKIVIYGPIKKHIIKLPILIEKSVCHDCVWCNEYLQKIYKKWNILTFSHIFVYNSKSILPQRAPFSYAGTQIEHFIAVTLFVIWRECLATLEENITYQKYKCLPVTKVTCYIISFLESFHYVHTTSSLCEFKDNVI